MQLLEMSRNVLEAAAAAELDAVMATAPAQAGGLLGSDGRRCRCRVTYEQRDGRAAAGTAGASTRGGAAVSGDTAANTAAKEQQAAGGSTGNKKQWAMPHQQMTSDGTTGDKDAATNSSRILWTSARPKDGRGHCRGRQAATGTTTCSNKLRHDGSNNKQA